MTNDIEDLQEEADVIGKHEDTEELEEVEDLNAASALPLEVGEPAVPIALTEIMPWHHPRKQFVREKQWKFYSTRLIGHLISQNQLAGDVIRYLTLPGIDYFDVEIIGQSVKDQNLTLEATGFHSRIGKERVRARSQVRTESLIKQGIIKDTSITFPYRFEDVAMDNSQAYREVKARAPFHIVNIDVCGSVARPSLCQPNRIVDAIYKIMELQFNNSRSNWLLFLTTDARNDNISASVIKVLKDAIRENCRESITFSDRAINLLSGDDDHDIEDALSHAEGDAEKFLPMFSLGLSKWLLHIANHAQWDVKSRPFYCYSTLPEDQDSPTMACLAFEFCTRPIPMLDRFGMVDSQPLSEAGHIDLSMQALKRSDKMLNLDSCLNNNQIKKRQYVASQRELLVNAGYQAAALQIFDEKFS